jgi:hypothetical protein
VATAAARTATAAPAGVLTTTVVEFFVDGSAVVSPDCSAVATGASAVGVAAGSPGWVSVWLVAEVSVSSCLASMDWFVALADWAAPDDWVLDWPTDVVCVGPALAWVVVVVVCVGAALMGALPVVPTYWLLVCVPLPTTVVSADCAPPVWEPLASSPVCVPAPSPVCWLPVSVPV